MRRLREAGLDLRLVTNTTSRPRRMIVEHLERLGFDVAAGDVVTPAALAVRHCLEADKGRVALVMNDAEQVLGERQDDAAAPLRGVCRAGRGRVLAWARRFASGRAVRPGYSLFCQRAR